MGTSSPRATTIEELGPEPRLVSALTLDYDDVAPAGAPDVAALLAHPGSSPLGSFLVRVTLTGYGGTGAAQALPPLELTYTPPQISDAIHTLGQETPCPCRR